MVNNAGIYRDAALTETDADEFDQVMAINVRGVFAGCRAAARDMLDRDEPGSIVNTTSISSEYAQLGHTMYDASKGAVMMITRVAALELARHDIRVNAVAPGIIRTTFGQGNPDVDEGLGDGFLLDDTDLPDLRDQDIEPTVPMGRMATPDEVAGAYLFLASDDASYVNGHLLYVDGGYQIVCPSFSLGGFLARLRRAAGTPEPKTWVKKAERSLRSRSEEPAPSAPDAQ